MTNPPTSDYTDLQDQAMLIAGEIFNLINQYTNDSNVSKFFLTDEIATSCYGLAGGFASVIYTKPISPRAIEDTSILSFIYALMTYGFNIYLKEHSFVTNSAPYSLPIDRRVIKKAQKETLELTSEGNLLSTPLADKIITIIFDNITNHIELKEFHIKGHRFSKTKFWDYSKLSLYWGYNFAKHLVEGKKRTKNRKN